MRTDEFNFKLPKNLIAQKPIIPRDSARLLYIGNKQKDLNVLDLPKFIKDGDILVLNDTKVIPARFLGQRGKATIEVTLHKSNDDGTWSAFARPARKLQKGNILEIASNFSAEVVKKLDGGEFILRFKVASLERALEKHGFMPLPPYIKRAKHGNPADLEMYQTIYARNKGAFAAPTAGLHFTDSLLTTIAAGGAKIVYLTLNVGAGTFLPVKVKHIADHKMHAEWGQMNSNTANDINTVRKNGGKVIACGTTVLRLLESATDGNGTLQPFEGETNKFITPGYQFKTVDRLMTNFHMPRTTLFMLVSAFSGLERMRLAYNHAIKAGYRFYSYGDACLLDQNLSS